MMKRKTVEIGDVFQIMTSEGGCYGQVIHTHPEFKIKIPAPRSGVFPLFAHAPLMLRSRLVASRLFALLQSRRKRRRMYPERFIVAIFRKFFSEKLNDFESLISEEPQIITPFLIQDAVRQGLFTLIDNVPVSERHKKFPVFRDTNNLRKDGKTMWWFWDGDKEWKVERPLTEEEKKYPSYSLPSAPLLIERIENNYRVEIDYI